MRPEEKKIIKQLKLNIGSDCYSHNTISRLCEMNNIECNVVQAVWLQNYMVEKFK